MGFKLAGGKGLREGRDSKGLWKSVEKSNIPRAKSHMGRLATLRTCCEVSATGNRESGGLEKENDSLQCELEQSYMVWILGLQRTHQDLKPRKLAHILQERVLQKKRPASETVADTSLQPFERGVTPSQQGQYASDLIVAVVRVSKGFWACASRG